MHKTPASGRLHIAIFGRRNAGKSSLINALTSQDVALVSAVPGTTTDPVFKAMEILPIGPVVIIDTAGLDDEGALGALRVKRTMKVLNQAEIGLLVVDPAQGWAGFEEAVLKRLRDSGVPVIIVLNKADTVSPALGEIRETLAAKKCPVLEVSALTRSGIDSLKAALIKAAPVDVHPGITDGIIRKGDTALLVIPIDKSAPKGRLILPQQMTIRDILDRDAHSYVVKETELAAAIDSLKKPPRIVITDSQAFERVAKDTPGHVPLTSFSILFARYKGDLRTLVEGLDAVERLRPGDRILIAEACTHHPTSDDIGRVKIPRWLENKVGGPLHFELCVGGDFPEDLESYSLVLHCGACMITRKAMLHRIMTARAHKVPITNYGVMIAWVHGILPRALAPLGISWPLRAPERLEIRTILASAGDPPESAGRYTPHRSMPNGGPSVI